ncbi:hypothetical protein Tco_0734192 [Tanacetum coccineum]
MAQLKYCDKHNQVGFLRKPDESAGFAEIVDFLRGSNLSSIPTIPTIIINTPVPSTSSPPGTTTPTPIIPYTTTFPSPYKILTLNLHHLRILMRNHLCLQKLLTPQEQAPSQMPMDDLLQAVPNLILRIDSLEMDLKQTKLTMGNAIVKLVKKVKKLEEFVKRRNLVLSDSEEEEPEVQGRKSQDDPLDSSVQGLVTPSTTKVNASGEEQEEDISPSTLEAAKTLSKVASLEPRSIGQGRRYKRRKEAKGKKVVSSLDFQEEVDAGAEQVNTASAEQVSTAEGVNTGSIKLSTGDEQLSTGNEQVSTVGAKKSTSDLDKGQREGKAPMISEETPKKLKEQVLQEEASLAEAIRLDTKQREEVAKQVHLDSLLAQRIAEEEELNEQQKKRKAQSMLGSELQGEDFAKKMVDLEVKKEFDKLVKQVESFAPISFEATKASLKRFGEELQTKTPKRLKDDKDDEAKDDEQTKKSGKRRKQMARWLRSNLYTNISNNPVRIPFQNTSQPREI